MWVIRPYVEPTEITIDLPPVLVESLGVGAGMLARHLTSLAEHGAVDPGNHPPPLPVLCRICERQIQPWWFEKHSELCMLEHKAESDVQLCQENLQMHRQSIVKILDAMDRRSSRPVSGELTMPPTPIEYRGLPIRPSSASSSGSASPGTPPSRSRDNSVSGSRSRGFVTRRPLVRIVELLLDLCDTAIEISTPAIKDGSGEVELGTFLTQSPQSKARIAQVTQWKSPTTNTLDEEKGLALLCQDTETAAKAKVQAVSQHQNIIEYSERIRLEFSMLVQDCIDEALRKATEPSNEEPEDDYVSASEDEGISVFEGSFRGALQRSNMAEPGGRLRRHSSNAGSGRSSPMECSTPKSQQSLHKVTSRRARYSHRSSMQFDNDGADSDTSGKSSLAAAIGHVPTDSPVSDHELTARISSRDHTRRSALQPLGSMDISRRQASPNRVGPSSSPLRIVKPRASMYESSPTPITSPLLSTGDFSPALEHNFHHRRQSSASASATLSEHLVKTGTPGTPSSPRLSGVNPSQQNRAVPPSIKDFEIIKPISKGAFGSVYLSKKKSTGDYFAIKVLKKADMIAKNQVTNVRAERAIMMVQGESDFVAKLYWTFASKDYLYLVMEYLNGGDCAALIKVLGGLPEEWARKYLAEVVVGLEHLHSRGIIHRDLKPDNLLIDQKGHLKLTDFGLSRMGLIGRQKRAQTQSSDSTPDLLKQGPFSKAKSVASSRSASFDYPATNSPSTTPSILPDNNMQLMTPSYFSLNKEGSLSRESSLRRTSNPRSDTSGSENLAAALQVFNLNDPGGYSAISIANRRAQTADDDAQSESSITGDFSALGLQNVNSHLTQSQVHLAPQTMLPPPLALFNPDDSNNRKFVGTPDYLAPETISGTGQDETSDWWSLGCILFEFLYGYPPFQADTPEEVFANILARKIDWPDPEEDEASPEAKDLMNQLMCTEQTERLGANGADEVRKHPFFEGLNWDTLLDEEAQFVPNPQNPEDTEYFDSRGATLDSFVEEMEDQSTPSSTPGGDIPDRPHDAVTRVKKEISNKRGVIPLSIPPHIREGRNRRLSEPSAQDDFGSFAFKNLPVLEKANKDVIQKLRTEALKSTPALATSNPSSPLESSPIMAIKPLARTLSNPSAKNSGKRPVSPNHLQHSGSSSARVSQPSSPLLLSFTAGSDKRKSSIASTASSLSLQSNTSSLHPGPLIDIPRLGVAAKSLSQSATTSPMKMQPRIPAQSPGISSMSTSPIRLSQDKLQSGNTTPLLAQKSLQQATGASSRVRSLTVGSTESEPTPVIADVFRQQQKRRSQVFDMSPSSSDNEDVRSSALLRVQRRRQSARRMSNISFQDGPVFRPLDVLGKIPLKITSIYSTDLLITPFQCVRIILFRGW
jgi:serine/threonine-protein kinase RIM15